MAVIKQGILGGFSGKIGSIVGSSWKGIAVIKSLPLSVAQPNTAKQVLQKDKFSVQVEIAKDILVDVLKPCLDRPAVKMSGYNYFLNLSKGFIGDDMRINPVKVIISTGRVKAGSELAGSVQ